MEYKHVVQTARSRCEFIWWLVTGDGIAGRETLTPSLFGQFPVRTRAPFTSNALYLQLINFFSVEMEVRREHNNCRTKVIDGIPSYCQTFIPRSCLLLPIETRDRGGDRSIRRQYLFVFCVALRVPFIFPPFNKGIRNAHSNNTESCESNGISSSATVFALHLVRRKFYRFQIKEASSAV